jgi:pyruvate decarboxylase
MIRYTVERYFEGWDAIYNDVPDWNYGGLFKSFSPHVPTNTFKVETAAELDRILSDDGFQNATIPQVRHYHYHSNGIKLS